MAEEYSEIFERKTFPRFNGLLKCEPSSLFQIGWLLSTHCHMFNRYDNFIAKQPIPNYLHLPPEPVLEMVTASEVNKIPVNYLFVPADITRSS